MAQLTALLARTDSGKNRWLRTAQIGFRPWKIELWKSYQLVHIKIPMKTPHATIRLSIFVSQSLIFFQTWKCEDVRDKKLGRARVNLEWHT